MNRRGVIASLVASVVALLAGTCVAEGRRSSGLLEMPGHRPFKPGDTVWYCGSGRFEDLGLAVIVDSQVCGRSFLILERSHTGSDYSFDDLSVIHSGKAWTARLSHRGGEVEFLHRDPQMGSLVLSKTLLANELVQKGCGTWGVVIDIDKAKRTACVRWSLGELKLVPETMLR